MANASHNLSLSLACLQGVWGVGFPPLPLRTRATPLSGVLLSLYQAGGKGHTPLVMTEQDRETQK